MTTSLITPFRSRLDRQTGWESEIDLFHFAALVRWQARCGVSAVSVAGWAGEGPTLSREERGELLRTAVAGKGAMKVLAHVGTPSTARSVALACDAAEAGADALVLVTPFYNRPTLTGIARHVEAVAEAASLPLFVEFDEAVTNVAVPPSQMAAIARIRGVAGIVDHSRNPLHVECTGLTRRGTLFLAGNERNAAMSALLGADGLFSALANVAPTRVVALWQAGFAGDTARAMEAARDLSPLAELVERHGVPALKDLAHGRIGSEVAVRLPLCALGRRAGDEAAALAGMIDRWPETAAPAARAGNAR